MIDKKIRRKIAALLPSAIYDWLTVAGVKWALKRVTQTLETFKTDVSVQDAISYVFSKEAEFVRPWQHIPEITALAERVKATGPKTVVEIGTANGGTLMLWGLLADPHAHLISIDLEFGQFGGGYPEWKIPFFSRLKRPGQHIDLIRGDSHSAETHQKLAKLLNGKQIDFLFIDGDHSYEGVKADFEKYSAFLADGALVAFHDIVPEKSQPKSHFVDVFWNEIKYKYQSLEFVQDWSQDKLGLGLLIYRK
jgi:predicted O-methyltransferase YrrM